MRLQFQLPQTSQKLEVSITDLVIAGWAGRDLAAIEHHIEELFAIGVPRPSAVPLFYRGSQSLLTQEERIQVVGPDSSGEVETFVFAHDSELYVSIASDHTDRKLETHSVALSKQICSKPVALEAWRLADVIAYWDELIIRSFIEENGKEVLYQEGALASLRAPMELVRGFSGAEALADGTGMLCGTVGAIGGIRTAQTFTMELFDPRLNRAIRHRYVVDVLPEVA